MHAATLRIPGGATTEDIALCEPHHAITADPDALEELADEIVVLSAHIHAATQRLLVLIAEFDRLRGWQSAGHRTCAHWLAARTGVDLGTAREKVRTAKALVHLPQTSAAMVRGELSFSQVRALTRVAQPDTECDLLELARRATTAQLERMIRAWRRHSRRDEADLERERYDARTFSVFPDDDGMCVVRGRFTPEVGALLLRAIDAAGDALFHAERAAGAGATAESGRAGVGATAAVAADDDERAAAQRRADAIALLAERARTRTIPSALRRALEARRCGPLRVPKIVPVGTSCATPSNRHCTIGAPEFVASGGEANHARRTPGLDPSGHPPAGRKPIRAGCGAAQSRGSEGGAADRRRDGRDIRRRLACGRSTLSGAAS